MAEMDILERHRVPIGGDAGINYIFSISPKDERADIDIVTRCETASRIIQEGWKIGMLRTHPLLIIGGGASGVTAALTALSLGVEGVCISTPDFFESQRNSPHRFLHPNVYRWPADGCNSEVYRPSIAGHGLDWSAGMATEVAEQWMDQTTRVLFGDPLYKKLPPVPNSVNSRETALSLIFTPEAEQEWGMVLFCIAPRETTTLGKVEGVPFWVEDDLDSCSESEHILVCGSGDGALQDFLRGSLPSKNIEVLRVGLEALLDEIYRVMAFNVRDSIYKIGEFAADDFDSIHEVCIGIVECILAHPEGKCAVDRFIDRVRDGCSKERMVVLVWGYEYFKKCYLINRFLVLLVGRWKEITFNHRVFFSGVRVKELNSEDSHYFGGFNPEECELHSRKFNRVVLRLGVEDCILNSENGTICVR